MRRGGCVPEKWTWPNGLLSGLHIPGGPGGTWNLGLPELRGLGTHWAGGGQEGAGVSMESHLLSSLSPALCHF